MCIHEELTDIKDRVEYLLKEYPMLQDDDVLLILAYLNRYHGLMSNIGVDSYMKLKSLLLDKGTPKFASIVRVRAKIQEQGMYQGTRRTERLEEAENVRSMIHEL